MGSVGSASVAWAVGVPVGETGDIGGIVKPAGTDTRPAPPGVPTGGGTGGLGELAAKTLPMLRERMRESDGKGEREREDK